jgi:hypothetical protein
MRNRWGDTLINRQLRPWLRFTGKCLSLSNNAATQNASNLLINVPWPATSHVIQVAVACFAEKADFDALTHFGDL